MVVSKDNSRIRSAWFPTQLHSIPYQSTSIHDPYAVSFHCLPSPPSNTFQNNKSLAHPPTSCDLSLRNPSIRTTQSTLHTQPCILAAIHSPSPHHHSHHAVAATTTNPLPHTTPIPQICPISCCRRHFPSSNHHPCPHHASTPLCTTSPPHPTNLPSMPALLASRP